MPIHLFFFFFIACQNYNYTASSPGSPNSIRKRRSLNEVDYMAASTFLEDELTSFEDNPFLYAPGNDYCVVQDTNCSDTDSLSSDVDPWNLVDSEGNFLGYQDDLSSHGSGSCCKMSTAGTSDDVNPNGVKRVKRSAECDDNCECDECVINMRKRCACSSGAFGATVTCDCDDPNVNKRAFCIKDGEEFSKIHL